MEDVINLLIMVQFTIQNMKMINYMVIHKINKFQIKLQKNVFIEMASYLVILEIVFMIINHNL